MEEKTKKIILTVILLCITLIGYPQTNREILVILAKEKSPYRETNIKGHRTPPIPLVYIIQDNDSNEEVLPNGEPIINVEIVDDLGNLIINTCYASIFKSVLFSLHGTFQIIITTDTSHYAGEVNLN